MSASVKSKKETVEQPPVEEVVDETNVAGNSEPVAGNTALTVFDPFADAEQYAGAGTSDATEDNIVPFFALLQKQSPQVEEKKASYVKGAKAGMLMNTASRKLYPAEEEGEGPLVILAHMDVHEVEWKPNRGGFVARHPANTPLLNQITEVPNPQNPESRRKMRMLPNGNQLVTTHYHYLVLVDTLSVVVLPMGTASTVQAHRRWNTELRDRKRQRADLTFYVPPSFLTVSRLRTSWMENDAGDWFNIAATDHRWVDTKNPQEVEAYKTAQEFWKLALAEGVKMGAEGDDAPDGAAPAHDPVLDGHDPDANIKDESPI